MMTERMQCNYPLCKNFQSRRDGDGGVTFTCAASPGLVLGSINLVEFDLPYEANGCHTARANGEGGNTTEGK